MRLQESLAGQTFRPAFFGAGLYMIRFITVKSLILAQDER